MIPSRKWSPPCAVIDCGALDRDPVIKLLRDCDTAEIAQVIRFLCQENGRFGDAKADIHRDGFRLKNTVDGITLKNQTQH